MTTKLGYPAEEVLTTLESFDFDHGAEALDYLRNHWYYDGATTEDLRPAEREILDHRSRHGRYLRLATLGWSGNEDLIVAYKKSWAYFMTWRLSARGGLEIHEYPVAEGDT